MAEERRYEITEAPPGTVIPARKAHVARPAPSLKLLAEQHQSINHYGFVEGGPVQLVDDGKVIVFPTEPGPLVYRIWCSMPEGVKDRVYVGQAGPNGRLHCYSQASPAKSTDRMVKNEIFAAYQNGGHVRVDYVVSAQREVSAQMLPLDLAASEVRQMIEQTEIARLRFEDEVVVINK